MVGYLLKSYGRHLALGVSLAVLWALLSGYFGKPVLIGFGVASIFLCVWLSDRAGMLDPEGVPTKIFPGILGYMVWLTFEIGKANVAVAIEALRPTLKLSPTMVRVPARQSSDLGKTIFGNSVTLTPGTVTIDVQQDTLLIHGLTEELADVEGMTAMGEKVCAFDAPSPRTKERA